VGKRQQLQENLCQLLSLTGFKVYPVSCLSNNKHLKNVGPIRHNELSHANSPGVATVLSHAACTSMSTTTTTTTRDRRDRYGPMEWAQLSSNVICMGQWAKEDVLPAIQMASGSGSIPELL